jgi:hypothetical protein
MKIKLPNQYSQAFGKLYDKTPKAVFAAVAYSFAMRLNEDNPEESLEEFMDEWKTLNEQAIVPQAPPKVWRA